TTVHRHHHSSDSHNVAVVVGHIADDKEIENGMILTEEIGGRERESLVSRYGMSE
ncbi:Hypothetical predicted protein, partial [Olea europaea subsp. europaea]